MTKPNEALRDAMTAKPMTPREVVEAMAVRCFSVSQFLGKHRSQDEIDECLEQAAAMLRAILAERDEAYRRGREDAKTELAELHKQWISNLEILERLKSISVNLSPIKDQPND